MDLSVVKPRFKFKHRLAGRYHWEPVNDAARALPTMVGGSTSIVWFWGGKLDGVTVTARAHARGGELGMHPQEYRDHVKALRLVHNHGPAEGRGLSCPERETDAGKLRGACMEREHLAYLAADVPPPFVPFSRGGYSASGGVLPAPVPAGHAVQLSPGYSELPKSAVARFGRGILLALNQGSI